MANEEIKKQNVERVLQVAYELFLVHGIENTTKEMLARQSHLSRKSVDRYFKNKTDCVLQVAEWLGGYIRRNINVFPESLFSDSNLNGAKLLELYMRRAKLLYVENPKLFVCRAEFKNFVYRNCDNFEAGYSRLTNALGCRNITGRIFSLGIRDASLRPNIDEKKEAEFFLRELFGISFKPVDIGRFDIAACFVTN